MHQEELGTSQIFQNMAKHVRSSQEELVAMAGDVTGVTNYWMYLGESIIEPYYYITPHYKE